METSLQMSGIQPGSRLHKLDTGIDWHEGKPLVTALETGKGDLQKAADCQLELHERIEYEEFFIGFRLDTMITYEVIEGLNVPSIDDWEGFQTDS